MQSTPAPSPQHSPNPQQSGLTQEKPRRSGQWGKVPRGALLQAIRGGVPGSALRTFGAVLAQAHNVKGGIERHTGHLAATIGRSKRTVQRDLAAIEAAQAKAAPLLNKPVPLAGFTIERRKQAADRNYANRYHVPTVGEDVEGTQIHLEWIREATRRGYSGDRAGFLVFLAEYLGVTGRQRTHRQMAQDFGKSTGFVRLSTAALAADGLLAVRDADPEAGESPIDGRVYRLLRPAELDADGVPLPPEVTAPGSSETPAQALARQRHAVRVRWVGMTVAALDYAYPGGQWWERVTAAAELPEHQREPMAAQVADWLRRDRKAAAERGAPWPVELRKIRRRDIARALPDVVAMRTTLDAEHRGGEPEPDPLDGVAAAWAVAVDVELPPDSRRWNAWRVAMAVLAAIPDEDEAPPGDSRERGRFHWLRSHRKRVADLVTALQSDGAPSPAALRAGVAMLRKLLEGGALPGLEISHHSMRSPADVDA